MAQQLRNIKVPTEFSFTKNLIPLTSLPPKPIVTWDKYLRVTRHLEIWNNPNSIVHRLPKHYQDRFWKNLLSDRIPGILILFLYILELDRLNFCFKSIIIRKSIVIIGIRNVLLSLKQRSINLNKYYSFGIKQFNIFHICTHCRSREGRGSEHLLAKHLIFAP